MLKGLEGKSAVVTGGASGIDWPILRQDAGSVDEDVKPAFRI